MKNYSGWEWLLIDAANQGYDDKKTFEERIEWATQNLDRLEEIAQEKGQWKERPLYLKAVQAIRKAQQGIATGHMVGVDAACSGIQVMSALTGCVNGARATGMVDPDRRADAYGEVTGVMNKILAGGFTVPRKDAKQAVMTTMYGSKKTPKEIFGEKTPELAAFYEAVEEVAPGPWELLQDLLASWQDGALMHAWKMPDGFDARIKVMIDKEIKIKVPELDNGSFTYQFKENMGVPKGHLKSKGNAANCVHSVDAYVLREMHRRCNYDREAMERLQRIFESEARCRVGRERDHSSAHPDVKYYQGQYRRSSLASAVILPVLCKYDDQIQYLDDDHFEDLQKILSGMLGHKPFPLVTVHDEFKAHPNNINQVRWHYKEILASIADSNLLDDLLTQIYKEPCSFNRLSFNLGDQIRQSSYALT